MTLDPWRKTSRDETSEFGIFRVHRYRARSPRTGEERPISVIDTEEWVNVVPLTPENEIVFVRQALVAGHQVAGTIVAHQGHVARVAPRSD